MEVEARLGVAEDRADLAVLLEKQIVRRETAELEAANHVAVEAVGAVEVGARLEQVLAREQDSLLVRVRQRFSLAPVVAACAGYRRYAGGVGQAADYPVVRLCWALLLRYLCGWSLRVLEHELRVNLLVRWCTHFALQEQTPDHTTLCRFEHWVRQHALDVLFVAVLEQIDVDFPDEAHERQCGDTFGVRANIADVSLNTLLRQSCLWGEFAADDIAFSDELHDPLVCARRD